MSDYHDREVLNAGTLGTYRVHSLFTKISSEGDLDPEFGEPTPGAVALHAHEYTHYLHNMSTPAGLEALQSCLWLIHPFVTYTDNRGFFNPPGDLLADDEVSLALTVTKATRGFEEGIPYEENHRWPNVSEWKFENLQACNFPLVHSVEGNIGNVPARKIDVRAIAAGKEINFTLLPGLDFISEGIAYEVEREQRRLSGIPEELLDTQTPSYPYLAFRPLLEFLIGRSTTSEERIIIGSLALLHTPPSCSLIEICEALREDFLLGNGSTEKFDQCKDYILNDFRNRSLRTDSIFTYPLKHIVAGSPDLSKGIDVYLTIIKKGLTLRSKHPAVELIFLGKALSPDEFRNATLHILERLVCQEKVGAASRLEWIGVAGSIADLSEEAFQKFTVLQTSIHYMQQHLTRSGLAATSLIKDTPCPFLGACEVAKEYGNPVDCGTRPWLVSVADGSSKVCWYEAGRLALRRESTR